MEEKELMNILSYLERMSFSKIELNLKDNYIKIERDNTNNDVCHEIASSIDEKILGEELEENIKIIKSPMVGTIHIKNEGDDKQFINIGDKVVKGQVIGVIEAMKLMNEIESEFDGEVLDIYVEDNSTVEYGNNLFKIRIK